jgi:hypothetical protein
MRSSVAGLLLLAAGALGSGCNQPLSGATLGGGSRPPGLGGASGRTTPGSGGATGSGSGNPGGTTTTGAGGLVGGGTASGGAAGNAGVSAYCSNLITQYQVAISAAQQCTLGGTGQCNQQVYAHLGHCDACLTFVNDTTLPALIESFWVKSGCDQATGHSCGQMLPCPESTNNVCVDLGSGTGKCAFTPGSTSGDGGSTTGADGGAITCGTIEQEYKLVLAAPQSCTPGVSGQCERPVPSDPGCGRNCPAYVNDPTQLNALLDEWDSLGCGNTAASCPAAACPMGVPSSCVSVDGEGICQQLVLAIPPGG